MNVAATKIIEALGGTAAVSRLFGLSMPSVSDWKRAGIPKARMMYLEVVHADKLRGLDLAAATSLPSDSSSRHPAAMAEPVQINTSQ